MAAVQASLVLALMIAFTRLVWNTRLETWGLCCFLAGLASMAGMIELATAGWTPDAVLVLGSACWLITIAIWRGQHI